MAELVSRRRPVEAPPVDPALVHYRRAVGVELSVAASESWRRVQVTSPRGGPARTWDLDELAPLLALTDWRRADEIDVPPARAWAWVDTDLACYAHERPRARLGGEAFELDAPSVRLARRANAWPTLAAEDPVAIAPIPFMPRGGSLRVHSLVGARFAVREREHEVLGLTITGGEAIGFLIRDLLPLLDGRADLATLIDAMGERGPAARRLLELLARATILERDPPPSPRAARLAAPPGPQLTWLGHAGVLVQAEGKSLLVDPIFFAPSDPPGPHLDGPRFDPRDLPAIDAVLITHGDNDHLNPNALAHLPRDTTIVVPRLRERPASFQVDVRALLELVGFTRIVELEPWAGLAIGELTVTACPFEGEDWDLDLPQATWLVESPSLTTFFSADAGPMPEVYRALAARARSIDVAFLGVGGCAEPLGAPAEIGYGNFYAAWVPAARRNEWRQHCAGPEDAVEAARILSPRYAFGYAAGGAPYIRTAFSDTGDHAQLAAALRASGLPTRPVALPLAEPIALDALAALADA